MTKLNKIDFLSGTKKLSNIRRGKAVEITQKNIDAVLSGTKKIEFPQILPTNAKVGMDAQNPDYKLEKIMGNIQAKLIENEKKDFGRIHGDISIRDLKNIPDWVKNDTTISDFINSGIGKLVYYGNLSRETILSLKLNFDKGFVYFDGLKYIFKRISCKKNVSDEIYEMGVEEYEKFGADEINDFLKA